jgi:hypothetical protein
MTTGRGMWFVSGCLALAGSRVLAQPPDQTPPPEAPPANWAPPPPAEPPPPAPPAESGSDAAPSETPPSATPPTQVAEDAESTPEVDIYGFAMLDIGYDFGHIGDPNWQDVLRPTKLPAFKDEFGKGGRTFEGVKQSRLGVAMTTPTSAGDIYTKFEFELFGTGVDAGRTVFRIRHAYGEWKGLRAGQTWSLFMDPDVFPDSIEYWGPNGMVFFRNVQLAYVPWKSGDSNFSIALEQPGASADQGQYADRLELESVVPRFPAPDVTANVKLAGPWGHVKLAGIFRYIRWDDLAPSPVVEGHVYGWGANLSSNIQLAPALIKLQAVYGRAIENYMNDAGADVGPRASNDPAQPIEGVGLPVLGLLGFVDLAWNSHFSSSVGYSFVWVDNSAGQNPEAFHMGHYALGNVLYHPTKNLFFGPEFQWGRRSNNSDGWDVNDYRLQFSVKYSFSHKTGGAKQ